MTSEVVRPIYMGDDIVYSLGESQSCESKK